MVTDQPELGGVGDAQHPAEFTAKVVCRHAVERAHVDDLHGFLAVAVGRDRSVEAFAYLVERVDVNTVRENMPGGQVAFHSADSCHGMAFMRRQDPLVDLDAAAGAVQQDACNAGGRGISLTVADFKTLAAGALEVGDFKGVKTRIGEVDGFVPGCCRAARATFIDYDPALANAQTETVVILDSKRVHPGGRDVQNARDLHAETFAAFPRLIAVVVERARVRPEGGA